MNHFEIMSTKQNPNAFPSGHEETDGMSLRDYFAAKALCLFSLGDKEIKRLEAGERLDHKAVAACAYGLADAMLAERQK